MNVPIEYFPHSRYLFALAPTVNVDDAMDDIVRQFKGVSDGLKRAVGTSPTSAPSSHLAENQMSLSWNQEEIDNHNLHNRNLSGAHSLSDGDSNYEDPSSSVNSASHSDNELNNSQYGSNDIKLNEAYSGFDAQASQQIEKPTRAYSDSSNMSSLNTFEDPAGIPPEVHVASMQGTSVLKFFFSVCPKFFILFRSGRQQMLVFIC